MCGGILAGACAQKHIVQRQTAMGNGHGPVGKEGSSGIEDVPSGSAIHAFLRWTLHTRAVSSLRTEATGSIKD